MGIRRETNTRKNQGRYRRYNKKDILTINEIKEKIVIGYCRGSSFDQKDDLERQISAVSSYCVARGYQYRIIQDLGSGLNYSKKGLKELINLISNKEICKIVVNYKDRLIRFGYEMIEELCDLNSVKIEVINQTEDKSYEQELVDDVLSIITVFSSKLYGSRSHKSKKIKYEILKIFQSI